VCSDRKEKYLESVVLGLKTISEFKDALKHCSECWCTVHCQCKQQPRRILQDIDLAKIQLANTEITAAMFAR